MSSEPVVYLLRTIDGRRARTYIGATVSLAHRLRQHNGERAGGARQTAGRAWALVLHMSGPCTWRNALRFEHAWRRLGTRTVRAWDVSGRLRALELLLAKERWSSTSPLARDVPLAVHFAADATGWDLRAPAHVPVHRGDGRAPVSEGSCAADSLRNVRATMQLAMQDTSDDVDTSLILPSGSRRVRKAPERYVDPDFAKIMMGDQERAELEQIDSDDDEEVEQQLESDEDASDDDDASYDSDFVEKDANEAEGDACAGAEDPDYSSEEEEEEAEEEEAEDEGEEEEGEEEEGEEEEAEDSDEEESEEEEAEDSDEEESEEIAQPPPPSTKKVALLSKKVKRKRPTSPVDGTGETPA
jgi:predicted GIY-YIG superfamily endonuclease